VLGSPGAGYSLANPRPHTTAGRSIASRSGTDVPEGSANAAITKIIDVATNGVLKKTMQLIERLFTYLPNVRNTLYHKK
jgi:hypothetical protein